MPGQDLRARRAVQPPKKSWEACWLLPQAAFRGYGDHLCLDRKLSMNKPALKRAYSFSIAERYSCSSAGLVFLFFSDFSKYRLHPAQGGFGNQDRRGPVGDEGRLSSCSTVFCFRYSLHLRRRELPGQSPLGAAYNQLAWIGYFGKLCEHPGKRAGLPHRTAPALGLPISPGPPKPAEAVIRFSFPSYPYKPLLQFSSCHLSFLPREMLRHADKSELDGLIFGALSI